MTLTDGEAKNILRGLSESGQEKDGFRGLIHLVVRFDRRAQASLSQAYLEVINPPGLKGMGDVVPGVQRWENRCGMLGNRYGDTISPKIRIAVLIGLLPKEYQDLILQNGSLLKEGEVPNFETIRDFVFTIVNQKLQMTKPTPMDIGCAEGGGDAGSYVCSNCEGWGCDQCSGESPQGGSATIAGDMDTSRGNSRPRAKAKEIRKKARANGIREKARVP